MTHYKNIKRTKEEIINHNKHILAVSGGDFGIMDNSTLEFAIDSINNETDALKQATNFLYYVGAGHPFENGNKRTAFEVAKGLMASGSIVGEFAQEDVVDFITGSLAQGKATKKDVYDWLSSHAIKTDEHPDFNKATTENIEKDKGWLKKLD